VTIVTYHSEPVRYGRLGRVYRPFVRRLLRRADRVLVTTDAYLHGSPLLRPFVDRCSVVPLGIDPRPFLDLESPAARALRVERPAVLFVGRLRHYKGLDVLVDAAASVDADFRIVGDGPMSRALRRQAAGSAAAERIRFFGQVPDADLPAHFAAADVVVLPSVNRSEAFGLVMLEAMAAGRPVVSTELGTGTSVVNQHGETGLVVPPHDAVALASALVTLLGDPERRAAMGEAGRRRVASQFHVDTMADRVVEIYRHTLAGAGVPPETALPRAS
jgi:rhamnosyl/mannosyltransferase